MKKPTKNLIEQRADMLGEQSDKMYFINKAIAYCDSNDMAGVKRELRRLKLLEDADIIYRLSRKDMRA